MNGQMKKLTKVTFEFEDGTKKILTGEELDLWEKIQLGFVEGVGMPTNEKQKLTYSRERVVRELASWKEK